jgi:hypothetical protein
VSRQPVELTKSSRATVSQQHATLRDPDFLDWFDIKKYAALPSLNAQDWQWQIDQRRMLCSMSTEDFTSVDRYDGDPKELLNTFELIKQHGILPPPVLTGFGPVVYEPTDRGKHRTQQCQSRKLSAVRSMSVQDVQALSAALPTLDNQQTLFQQTRYGAFTVPTDINDRSYTSDTLVDDALPGESTLAHLSVDLSHNKDELIRQLGLWLTQAIKSKPVEGRAKNTDPDVLKNWVKRGILPLTDLKLWEVINHTEIPTTMLVNKLNGDGGTYFDSNRVRTTCTDLMKSVFFNRL